MVLEEITLGENTDRKMRVGHSELGWRKDQPEVRLRRSSRQGKRKIGGFLSQKQRIAKPQRNTTQPTRAAKIKEREG